MQNPSSSSSVSSNTQQQLSVAASVLATPHEPDVYEAHVENKELEITVDICTRSLAGNARDITWTGKHTSGLSGGRGSRVYLHASAGSFINHTWYNKETEDEHPLFEDFLTQKQKYPNIEGHNAQEFCGECVGHCIAPIEASNNGWLRFDDVQDLEDAVYTHWSDIEHYFCGNVQGFFERLKEIKQEHPLCVFILGIGKDNSPLAVLFDPETVLRELHWIEQIIEQHNVTQEWL